jgi:cell division protein FtsX
MNNADDTQRIAEDMVNFLWAMDDVAHVELISDEAVATMLKPWLGEASSSSLFALPVVIDVTLLDGSTLDAPALREQLGTISPDVQVDHHQAWLRSLQGIIDVGQGVALALLGVIIGVTILTIIGLTRITLALNRDIIEVLQFCGATDAFIADQFVASMVRIMVRAIALGMVVGVVVLASAWAALPTGVWLTPIQQGNLLVLAMDIGLLAFISLSLAIVCSRFAAIRALKHG